MKKSVDQNPTPNYSFVILISILKLFSRIIIYPDDIKISSDE